MWKENLLKVNLLHTKEVATLTGFYTTEGGCEIFPLSNSIKICTSETKRCECFASENLRKSG